jgi:hypothetical protein
MLSYIKTALYVLMRMIRKEFKQPAPISVFQKILLWMNGYYSASYVLYDLQKNNRHLYLSDWAENFKGKFINKNTIYIDNKILFPQIASPYVRMTDEPYLIMHGKLIPLNKKRNYTDIEGLLKDIKTTGPKVFKPIDGASGNGILKISFENNQWFINQKAADENNCAQLIASLSNYLVSNFINQADYSTKIYAKSVNTVRILTMVDPDNGEAFIAAAAHRIGNSRSYPVDNCAAGGFTAGIDIATGKMGKATSTVLSGSELKWYGRHPDSNAEIEGVFLPNWSLVTSSILSISQSLSFIPYIGWDIVLTNEGFTIIEANDGPDIKLHQVHQPLLANPRVKKFYTYYHVI